MKTWALGAVAFSLGPLAVACQSLGDRALDVEQLQCSPAAQGAEDERILQTTAVLRVEGEYSLHTSSGVQKLTATKILVRPPEGVSLDRMTRIVQCHGAREVLRRGSPATLPSDPYYLPDVWVDIDLRPERGNWAILLSSNTVTNALRVFRRAKEYALAQRDAGVRPAP